MVGVANRYQRNRRGPTPAGTKDQCLTDLPVNVGPVQLDHLGNWVTARDLDPLMRQAGGLWDLGARRWLIEQRRIGPLIRALWRRSAISDHRHRPGPWQMSRDSDLYGEDIRLWSEAQGALLRRLAAGEAVIDQVDWPHVIEEVEDLGRSDAQHLDRQQEIARLTALLVAAEANR
jgi:hypothetical protein